MELGMWGREIKDMGLGHSEVGTRDQGHGDMELGMWGCEIKDMGTWNWGCGDERSRTWDWGTVRWEREIKDMGTWNWGCGDARSRTRGCEKQTESFSMLNIKYWVAMVFQYHGQCGRVFCSYAQIDLKFQHPLPQHTPGI